MTDQSASDCLKWNDYWREGAESQQARQKRRLLSLSSILKLAENIMKRGRYRLIKRSLKNLLPSLRNAPVLDIGCGLGRTVLFLRKIGLSRTIGIDWAMEGLKVCQGQGLMIGKDVFQMDCKKTSFSDGHFRMVFSEGILEHYADFTPLVKEMARISNAYVYILQPNHFSFCGRLRVFALRRLLKGANEDFPELSYRMEDFISSFDKNGYRLILRKNTFLGNYTVLLFERAC